MKRIIALILSLTMVFSLMIMPSVSVNAADAVVKKVDFNDLNSSNFDAFKKTVIAGGAYVMDGFVLESATKYGASGNSIKMGGIAKADHRVKFVGLLGKDTLTTADKGKKYTVSAYVYSPKATTIYMGLFGAPGTEKAFSPTANSSTDIPANAWTLVQLGIEVNDEMITNNTTQIGFEQKGTKSLSDTIYIDEIVVTEGSLPASAAPSAPAAPSTPAAPAAPSAPAAPATPSAPAVSIPGITSINFDDWTAIDNSKFMAGGAYSLAGLSLSNQYDHTSGKGNSLCIGNRSGSGRLKLVDMFNAEGIGTTYNISAWVYTPKAASVMVGVYSTVNTDYATAPLKSSGKVSVPANTWTQISFEYSHENEIITQLGFEPNVDTTYIDDIVILPAGMELPTEEELAMAKIPEEYREYVKLFNSLGLLENFIANFDATATMTREKFASVLADFLPNNVATSANTVFSDVPSTSPYSGAIKALTDIGVFKGDGEGKFNPSAEIAAEEVISALVSYLGYEVYTQSYGGYPSGYITTASKMGLLDGVSVTVGKPMTQAEMFKLITNFIKIDVLEETQFGDTTKYATVEGRTILSKNLDIYFAEGQVIGSPVTMLSTAAGVGINRVQIDDLVLKTNENINDYLGYQVEYYYNKGVKNLPELLYIAPIEGLNDTITVLPADIADEDDSSKWYYYDSETGKKKFVRYDGSQNIIYNGVYKTFDRELLSVEEGDIKFLDSDCDGVYETIFVNNIYYIVVSSVDKTNEIIYDKYDPLKKIDFDSSDESNSVRIFNASGKEISIDDLKEWDVLTVRKSTEAESVYELVMARKTVKGVVTGYKKDDDGRIKAIKIGEKYYEVSETFKNMFTTYDEYDNMILEPELNRKVVLYLGELGTVVTYDTDTSIVGKLGYLLEVDIPEGSGAKMTMEILDQSKKINKYTIADKVYENGSTTALTYRQFKVKDTFYNPTTYEPKRQLVMYDTNAEGEINKIWYFAGNSESGAEENQFYQTLVAASNSRVYYSGGTNRILYKGSNTGLQTKENWMLSNNVVVFVIPTATYADDHIYYSVSNASNIPSSESGTSAFVGYSLTGDDRIIDVVIRQYNIGGVDEENGGGNTMFINDVTRGINDEDEEILIVTGLVDGAEKTIEVVNERSDSETHTLSAGDYITYSFNPNGKCVFTGSGYNGNGVVIYSNYLPTNNKTFGAFKTTSSSYNYSVTQRGRTMRTYGIPYELKDGILQFHPYNMTTKPTGSSLPENPNIQLVKPEVFKAIYVFDTTTNKFRTGTVDEIVTASLDPVNYTPIYMYAYENNYRVLIIYK